MGTGQKRGWVNGQGEDRKGEHVLGDRNVWRFELLLHPTSCILHPLTHTHSLTHSHSLTLTHTHSYSHSHTHTHTLTLTWCTC